MHQPPLLRLPKIALHYNISNCSQADMFLNLRYVQFRTYIQFWSQIWLDVYCNASVKSIDNYHMSVL